MKDVISLNNARFQCLLGINEDEKRTPQGIEIDIGLHLDTEQAGLSDRIEDAVDYAAVHETVREAAAARHYNLIESLAGTIAAAVLKKFAVSGVTVRIRKPRALASRGVDCASIEITRYR